METTVQQIYQAYPRKLNPRYARECIAKALERTGLSPEELLEKTQEYAQMIEECDFPRDSIPHPSTWFNQERWDEEFEARRELVLKMREKENKVDQPKQGTWQLAQQKKTIEEELKDLKESGKEFNLTTREYEWLPGNRERFYALKKRLGEINRELSGI